MPYLVVDPQGRSGLLVLASLLCGLAGEAVAQGGTPATCAPVSEAQVMTFFDDWNAALATRDPDAVVALYAKDAILLPTLSNRVRHTPAERRDYFEHFLKDGPAGSIDERNILLGCNSAIDAGLYTFTFADTDAAVSARYSYTYAPGADGVWRITTHHSSLMPEPVE